MNELQQFFVKAVMGIIAIPVGFVILYFATKLVTFAYYRAKEQASILNGRNKIKHEENQ